MPTKQEKFREMKKMILSILNEAEDGTSLLEIHDELVTRLNYKSYRRGGSVSAKCYRYTSIISNVAKNSGFTLEKKRFQYRHLIKIDGEEVWHTRIQGIKVLRRDNDVNN